MIPGRASPAGAGDLRTTGAMIRGVTPQDWSSPWPIDGSQPAVRHCVGGFLTWPRSAGAAGRSTAPRPGPSASRSWRRQTGRGVPLVELRTVNQIRYLTDSNGIVAFDEPGLLDAKVFFNATSHGYEADQGRLRLPRHRRSRSREGGSAGSPIRRLNIAERLYRVTGAGIYRDSVLTGDPVADPRAAAQRPVMGQDSVVNAVFQGKIHWFWGDTNRPDYPLGNFHVPGATSELPGRGGLEPDAGVDLHYFVDDKGFARPTAPMPGDGPTWISGLVVLTRSGRPRADVRQLRQDPQDARGLPAGARRIPAGDRPLRKGRRVPRRPAATAATIPAAMPFLHEDRGRRVRLLSPRPTPCSACGPSRSGSSDPASFEAYTCSEARHRADPSTSSTAARRARSATAGRRNTQVLPQDLQDKLIASGRIHRRRGALEPARRRSAARPCWRTAARSTGTITASAG